MTETSVKHEMATRRVLFHLPGMEAIAVRRDLEYRQTDAGMLTLDLYAPPDRSALAPLPAVVIVAGYPDAGFQKHVGCRFKEMGSTSSWGQLLAASGIAAIAYANREPVADAQALLEFLHENAGSLGIDAARIGLWSSSGNSPLALAMLMGGPRIQCATFCYGYMLDPDGAEIVAPMSRAFGFVNPCAGRTVEDLPPDVPLFLARAGRDQTPRLNETLDAFVSAALGSNLPITFANLPGAPHAFDLLQDDDASRAVIRQILAFLQHHLRAQAVSLAG